uniref:molybdopterin biosynthesis protein n=1 Tax=Synarthrophyton patena TaxID=48972 RepID=UPI0021821FA2|nr:molybdopterin biosynthesis protein [Synarthrophyton patena]UVF62867.1 molybdopterin biosynthesis protein [Synarthrophyton patena]
MLNPSIKIETLNHIEYERYSRHLILENISQEGQKRINKAKILFIGAGGLNSSSLLYLTASGVGIIGIMDNDQVELSNLQRQVIYNINDITKNKVKAAKDKLNQLNPLIDIKTYNYLFTENNAYNIIADYDIVIDGTDNFTSRDIISKYCHLLHKIHIYGAVEKFIGQISVFNYQNGPNYYDLYKKSENQKYETCSERGVLNTLTAIIGIMQATEAIKVITGIGNIINGYLLRYNSLDLSLKMIRIKPIKHKKNTKLILHKCTKSYVQSFKPKYIYKQELKNLLENTYYQLIDIREPTEFNFQNIHHSINIPLKRFKTLQTIQYIKKQLTNKILIIYCNNELRSYIAAKILHRYQIKYYILKGGIKSI